MSNEDPIQKPNRLVRKRQTNEVGQEMCPRCGYFRDKKEFKGRSYCVSGGCLKAYKREYHANRVLTDPQYRSTLTVIARVKYNTDELARAKRLEAARAYREREDAKFEANKAAQEVKEPLVEPGVAEPAPVDVERAPKTVKKEILDKWKGV